MVQFTSVLCWNNAYASISSSDAKRSSALACHYVRVLMCTARVARKKKHFVKRVSALSHFPFESCSPIVAQTRMSVQWLLWRTVFGVQCIHCYLIVIQWCLSVTWQPCAIAICAHFPSKDSHHGFFVFAIARHEYVWTDCLVCATTIGERDAKCIREMRFVKCEQITMEPLESMYDKVKTER
jgi:hypothetical protein